MNYKLVNQRVVSPATKLGEYKLNNIIEVIEDGNNYYRIYVNNANYFVKVPADLLLLSQIKDITWTKESKTNVIKSYSNEEVYLSEILKKFNYRYTIKEGKFEDLAKE